MACKICHRAPLRNTVGLLAYLVRNSTRKKYQYICPFADISLLLVIVPLQLNQMNLWIRYLSTAKDPDYQVPGDMLLIQVNKFYLFPQSQFIDGDCPVNDKRIVAVGHFIILIGNLIHSFIHKGLIRSDLNMAPMLSLIV